MAYNKFTMLQLRDAHHLQVIERAGLFVAAPPAVISDWLRETLRKQTPLALRVNSEKARSESLIYPVLIEVYDQMQEQVNLFPGVEFNVDRQQGLAGFCDYLFSRSPLTREIETPVLVVVEAKKENINAGIPQCFAELVAAQIFNERAGQTVTSLYGVITTGTEWQFVRLQGTEATIDSDRYALSEVEKIVGIILSMLR